MSTEKIVRPFPVESVPWETWAEVPGRAIRYRHLTGAAGDRCRVGVAIEELAPGMRTMQAHYHYLEEEHVFVLEGSLTVRLGAGSREVKAGGYVCFPAGQTAGHFLFNNGDQVARYVIVGENFPNEVVVFPDSNKVMVRSVGRRAIFDMAATRRYWDGEPGLPAGFVAPGEISPMPGVEPHPKSPISLDDMPWEPWSEGSRFGGRVKHLTKAVMGRDYHVGVLVEEVAAGKQSCPLHYHMAEEEQVIVLAGRGTLRLGDERIPVKAWDYAAFPAGQRVGHCFVAADDEPLTYLIVGERKPFDVCVYPESNKIAVCALPGEGIFDMGAKRGYWDGEKTE